MKKIFNHYFDERSEIMKETQFKVEDVFGDNFNKDTFSPKQITKLNNLFNQNIVNKVFSIKISLFKPRKKKIIY